jgi:predicted nuclease of restriction endonuclease-like RecB superfamily
MAKSSSIHPQHPRKFKSGLERVFSEKAKRVLLPFSYEPDRFKYVITSHYTPDFKIRNDVYIETKGYFSGANRARLLSFKEQYPHITIYLLFQRPENFIDNKTRKTTYGQWATKHGFEWAGIERPLPKQWWFPKGEKNNED